MDFPISDYITNTKGIFDIFKAAKDLLPSGPNRNEIEQRLKLADDMLKRSDAKLAHELGYNLCQCTYPPQIMLRRHQEKAYVCDACGDRRRYVDPSDFNNRQKSYLDPWGA